MTALQDKIARFLSAPAFAVAGASGHPDKYGHKVYKCLIQNNRKAYPVNPNTESVLGHDTYPDLRSLPEQVESVSVITPPAVTGQIIDDAIAAGVKNIWIQPGAENWPAIEKGKKHGLNIIAGGPCLLVTLRFMDF